MNYLVTGGAGFIGSNLVDRLLSLKHKVVVLDDFSAGKEENLAMHKNNGNLSVVKRSITENLDDIFKDNKFDTVFHLAAIPRVQYSIENPLETHNINVNGTHNLLDMCRKFGVKRFVFSSSSAIYGDQDSLPLKETMKPNPMSPYAMHKLIGEQYCKLFQFLYGIETVMLRYFNVYGPRQDPNGNYACLVPKFMKIIQDGKSPKINGDGNQTRDFIHVSDVVNANIIAANSKNKKCIGEAFNIGSGTNLSVNAVTNELIKVLKSKIKPTYGPAVIEPKDTLSDISKAKSLLGWNPEMSFEEGLREAL